MTQGSASLNGETLKALSPSLPTDDLHHFHITGFFPCDNVARSFPFFRVPFKICDDATRFFHDQCAGSHIPKMEIVFKETAKNTFGHMNQIKRCRSASPHSPACSHKPFKMP